MRIIVTVEDPEPGFLDKFTALLAEHGAQVQVDTEWTADRAKQYYVSLPEPSRRIVREAAVRDGYVPAEELRDEEGSSLRGHSAPLKRTLERGVRMGWWPEGMQPPIVAAGPGFGKVVGYRMPGELVQTFFTAIKEINDKEG